ncbi:MAG: hypothetical protein KAJ19_11490 [Gammaproteobacteria bacterium]|nr:hypothetical protein [Gammaproteobacteria bacterium]
MALNSNALITVDTYHQATGGTAPGSDPLKLARAEFVINAASDYFETETNRTFLSGSAAVDVFDGEGASCLYDTYHTVYATKQAPITSTPILEKWDGSAWEAVDRSTYTYEATEGEVYFPRLYVSENYFVEGTRNYRTTYLYGYNGRANIPGDIQMTVAIIAKLYDRSIDYAGITSTTDDNGRGFSLTMPEPVNVVIRKYTR